MIVETIDRDESLPPLTQKEVAEFYTRFRGQPLSKTRVAQIEQAALAKLKRAHPELSKLLADGIS